MIRNVRDGLRNLFSRLRSDRKGAAMVEYALLVAGVALIGAGAVSLLGHKTGDLLGTMAAILPGSHGDDNAPVQSGHLIETTLQTGADGKSGMAIDVDTIIGETNSDRLGANAISGGMISSNAIDGLVIESR